jgi:hypothetical protein
VVERSDAHAGQGRKFLDSIGPLAIAAHGFSRYS